MMTLLVTFGALFLVFMVAVAGIGLWASRTMRARQVTDERQKLITLAALAAGDESGLELLRLLRALEAAPPNQPVTVDWLARRTPQDDQPGFLVKISWDGNEWRRAQPAAQLRAQIEARLEEDRVLAGPLAQKLLSDLRAADTSSGHLAGD